MRISDFEDTDALDTPMLEEIRRTAQRRLRQIEPLIAEAERLRDVIAVIEERAVTDERTTVERSPLRAGARIHEAGSAEVSARRAPSAPRAAKGANKRLILELIGQRPGITPAEIAQTTGLKRTVVASTVSRLKRHGELRDHERGGVCLAALAASAAASTQRQRASGGEDKSERPPSLASVA